MIEFPRGVREARLVGGPKDGEILAVREDDYQVTFYAANLHPAPNQESIQYREHTYVRDPDSFAFIYAGSVPVSKGRVTGHR